MSGVSFREGGRLGIARLLFLNIGKMRHCDYTHKNKITGIVGPLATVRNFAV